MHAASWGHGETTHVLVHGLGGSHVNWSLAGGALADAGRVLAPDLPGFGRTAPEGAVSIPAMHAALERFIDATCKRPIVLVGHSMGGLISVLQASRRPETVKRLVLVAPALPPVPMLGMNMRSVKVLSVWMAPYVGPEVLRRRADAVGPEGVVRDLLSLCMDDVDALQKDVLEAHVELARSRRERPWTDASLSQAARSLFSHFVRRFRVHGWMKRVRAPVLVVQGGSDRLVLPTTSQAAVRRCPSWRLEVLPGIGHVPPLEAPERFIQLVRGFTAES
jgi:pimeloyl-ACP methyl ester carboxylesterase